MAEQQDPNRLVGTTLGSRFEITSCVSIDEAGALYDAKDSELGTPASVRVLHRIRPDDASLRRLLELLTEVSNLAIPGIKPLRAVGRTRTQDVYYATDKVYGESLAQRLDHGAMRPLDAVDAIAQAGDTLSRAHANGVVHGALHPGAVILPGRDGAKTVQLLDFGLGPLVMAADVLPMGTRSAATPYQSPEQAKGDPFDQRADVYALGALLYEALTGRPPFAGRSALEILAHQLRGEAPSLAEVEPTFEGSPLQELIDQSMKVDPDDRFATIDAMAHALRNAGKAEARRKKPPLATKKPTKAPAAKTAGAKAKGKGKTRKPPKKGSASSSAFDTGQKESPVLYVVGGLIVVAAIVLLVLWKGGYIFAPPQFDDDLDAVATSEPEPEQPADHAKAAPAPPRTSPRPDDDTRDQASPRRPPPPPVAAQDRPPLSERAQKLISEGQQALASKQYTRAISKFRLAKRAAPDAPEVARGLGLALMYAGQTSAAARELERYLELDPLAPDARFIRGSIRTLRQ